MTASTVEPVGADGVRIELKGRITAYTAAPIWRSALEKLAGHPDCPIIVDASQVEYVDNVGIALLLDLIQRDRPPTAKVEIRDLAPKLGALVDAYNPKDFAAPARGRTHPRTFEEVGRATTQQIAYAMQVADSVGECWVELRQVLTRRGRINWNDTLDIATEAGANGVPVVLLIGFLMGVIIAFQSGLVAKQFGAVIFVVNGVGRDLPVEPLPPVRKHFQSPSHLTQRVVVPAGMVKRPSCSRKREDGFSMHSVPVAQNWTWVRSYIRHFCMRGYPIQAWLQRHPWYVDQLR